MATGLPNDGNDLQTPAAGRPRSWYQVDNAAATGGTAEVWIYDEIGWYGITAQAFVDELNALDVDTIELHLNSPGGDVFDGLAIYNALLEHDAQVHVMVDALAASAASFIAQAGDRVTMAANSQMMIHDAFGICAGNADDMTEFAALLNRLSDNLATLYATRTGEGSTDSWRDAMRAESWYSAPEAVKAGLADDVAAKSGRRRGSTDDEATNRWDLGSMFRHAGRDHAPDPVITPAARHAPTPDDKIPVDGAGTAAGQPAPSTDGPDPWDDLDAAAFTGLADVLDEVVADPFHLDPDVVRSSIRDAYHNAPATPAVPATPPPPPTAIAIDQFVDDLVSGVQEALT
jgi:ATP-dependent Clp endopeptidase proteolytic subunit ClpP